MTFIFLRRAAASLVLLRSASSFAFHPSPSPRTLTLSVSSRSLSVSLQGYLDSLSTATTTNPSHTVAMGDFAYVPVLSLGHADAIADAAIRVCQRNGFNPVTVFVLDSSGSAIVSKRMDGCSPVGSPDFSFAKAYSCIVNKYPSRNFRDRYTAEPNQAAKFCQLTSMVAISQGKMAPFPGGILLLVNGHIVGAVGVSGAAGDEDEYCAIQGVLEANIAGLVTVPEKHSCTTLKDPQ